MGSSQGFGSAGGCPTADVAVTVGDCQPDGTRVVTFDVSVTPSAGGGTVVTQLDLYGDGTSFAAASTDLAYQRTHAYAPPGPFSPRLVIVAPAGCPDVPVAMGPLGGCPPGCPDADDVTTGVDGCDSQGNRVVWVTVLLPGSGQTTASIDWLDGSAPDSGTIQAGQPWTRSHAYPPPGPYKARVDVKGCGTPIIKAIGPLDPCPDPPPPDRDDEDEGFSCRALRWAFVIAASLASCAAIIGYCMGSDLLKGIGLGAALVALVTFVLWKALCPEPCGWGHLMAWQVTLGTGIGVLHFTICCPLALWLGLLLVVAAGIWLIAWKRKCRVSDCGVYTELAAVVAGVVMPVLGWVLAIPAFQACKDPLVVALVDSAAGVMVLLGLACASGGSATDHST
jgi:hypothetical protein